MEKILSSNQSPYQEVDISTFSKLAGSYCKKNKDEFYCRQLKLSIFCLVNNSKYGDNTSPFRRECRGILDDPDFHVNYHLSNILSKSNPEFSTIQKLGEMEKTVASLEPYYPINPLIYADSF